MLAASISLHLHVSDLMDYLAAERPNSKRLSFQGKQSEVCDEMYQTLSFWATICVIVSQTLQEKFWGSLRRNAPGRLGCVDCVQSYCDCYVEITAPSNKSAPCPSPLESSVRVTPTQGGTVDPLAENNRERI